MPRLKFSDSLTGQLVGDYIEGVGCAGYSSDKVAPHHNFTDKDRWKYSVTGGGGVYA